MNSSCSAVAVVTAHKKKKVQSTSARAQPKHSSVHNTPVQMPASKPRGRNATANAKSFQRGGEGLDYLSHKSVCSSRGSVGVCSVCPAAKEKVRVTSNRRLRIYPDTADTACSPSFTMYSINSSGIFQGRTCASLGQCYRRYSIRPTSFVPGPHARASIISPGSCGAGHLHTDTPRRICCLT